MAELKQIIAAIWGTEGSGKTSMALTFPKPLKHYDLDVGGYDRAAWRIETEGVTSTSYPIPLQTEKLMGARPEKSGSNVSVRFPRRVVGYKELWQQIVTDYVEDCKNTALKTIVIDSATQLWTVCHTSLLQEKQEIQLAAGIKETDPKFREKLLPIEFPNDRMRSLIYTARSYGKNLVLTHYPRNIYKQRFDSKGELVDYKSDELEPDGFKDTSKLVDLVVWTYTDSKDGNIVGRAKITVKCGVPGLGMTAVGLELPSPTYQGIVELREVISGG